ncbi:MAG: amino acid adenylation domain-containing protein, partial [Phormidesmis sp.]
IGLFVNTIVIRTQVKNNPRFSDFLAQVRNTTLEAYSHQDLPFEQLIDALDIPRSRSQTPLVQVMFALQSQDVSKAVIDLNGSKLAWTPLTVQHKIAKFDLTLDVKETPSGLTGRWEYRSDLFSADTIHRMAGHFRRLLKALPGSSEARLSELPMLSRQEVEQLRGWSQQKEVSTELTATSIHQQFEFQVAATPEAIALIHHQTQLTYQALNQRANQLAHYLQQQGVGLETPVGLWAVRSPETIISMLAILKAGGTYVPLDPDYPAERLAWLMQDTQIKLLIANRINGDTTSAIKVPVVDLSAVIQQIAKQPERNLSNLPQAHSLAYIIYTSGSTGMPKGVCVTHQGVTRLVRSPNYATLSAEDVILQAAPLTFDASTFEIWGALLNGGKLVLLPDDSPSLESLGNAIKTHQITTLWLTSGLFNLMVDEQLSSLRSVRQLLAGGDVLSKSHLSKALETLKETTIINGYGPTEGTTFTCCHTITAQDVSSTVPIGYPIQQTQVYVLDAHLQQVPAGIPGELYIGGAGVARGYLNQPALTAERFIPNPFYSIRQQSDRHSFYLYKTGDRVRYRADGALEYLGRLDQQVKVRGFRIEPGEIETMLESHLNIQQAAVILSGAGDEQKRLIAYVEMIDEAIAIVNPLDLREFLLDKLPDYMMPAKFVLLKAMPLTANGKIDKKSLPMPQWNEESPEHAITPQTDTEQTLIEIFTALLPAKSVGIHDNFFELGGDSILAMQIVSKASQAGLKISPKQLFQYQTVAALAAVAQKGNQTPIPQLPAVGQVPLTPIQRWFFEQNLAVPQHFNQSICLELPREFDRDALAGAIAHIYQHHDALRLRFIQTDSGWQQTFSDAIVPPTISHFDFSQMSADKQAKATQQAVQMLQANFNLQHGPLMGIGIFSLGNQSSQLFIAIHHLVIDGVSWRILLVDLQQAYQQAVASKTIQLAPKTHSYQQWAQALEQMANSPEVEADLEYWQAICNTQSHESSQNGLAEENTTGYSRLITTTLSAELTADLLTKVPPIYNTQITEALLTAFTQALTEQALTEQALLEQAGNTPSLIDLESYGRFSDSLDLSLSVGWFTARYLVSLTFNVSQPIGENFQSIKAQLRAVPNQGMSYGLLRYMNQRYANQRESLAITPAVSFNYLGQLDAVEKGEFRRAIAPNQASSSDVIANNAAKNSRPHLLDVNSWIAEEQLTVQW